MLLAHRGLKKLLIVLPALPFFGIPCRSKCDFRLLGTLSSILFLLLYPGTGKLIRSDGVLYVSEYWFCHLPSRFVTEKDVDFLLHYLGHLQVLDSVFRQIKDAKDAFSSLPIEVCVSFLLLAESETTQFQLSKKWTPIFSVIRMNIFIEGSYSSTFCIKIIEEKNFKNLNDWTNILDFFGFTH